MKSRKNCFWRDGYKLVSLIYLRWNSYFRYSLESLGVEFMNFEVRS